MRVGGTIIQALGRHGYFCFLDVWVFAGSERRGNHSF
jgi:hypothetical protein